MGTVVALAGGVGGAKLAFGLDRALPADPPAIVVNTADDLELHGLHVSPDLDTVMYTLAGLADREHGWGLAGETWNAAGLLERYDAETWFQLGDADLATHLRRTERLRAGAPLTAVTGELAAALGVRARILPMSDDPVRTWIRTETGWVEFQEWFVRRAQRDPALQVRWEGIDRARPTSAVLSAVESAELIVVCPSNPFVSVGPILALPGLLDALLAAPAPLVAVSPIVAGRALRGPADRMLATFGLEVSAAGVAGHYVERYPHLVDGFVIDRSDEALAARIERLGLRCLVGDAVMISDEERIRLARQVLAWGAALPRLA